MYKICKASKTLTGICLRPGTLTDAAAGHISLGKLPSVKGNIPRETVAQVADALLAADGIKTSWLDLLSGEDEIEAAVDRCVKNRVNTAEGEPVYDA